MDSITPVNKTRVRAAFKAIREHARAKGEQPPRDIREARDCSIRDLLADLMHLWGSGDGDIESWNQELESARNHFLAEVAEENAEEAAS